VEIFLLTLKQMLMMFFLIMVGYFLRKGKILPENSHVTMSKLETYVLMPALILYNQISRCTVQTFSENSSLILYGLVLVLCSIGIAYPLCRLFVRNGEGNLRQRNVYRYALAFGNYGFMGNFIILGVWGDDMFYKYLLFLILVDVFCNSWGLHTLISGGESGGIGKNIRRSLTAPPVICLGLGMLIGLLNLSRFVPDFLMTAFEKAGNCQGPVAMVLAGFVIGGYDWKKLLLNGKVYLASLFRLILIPGLMMLALKLLGTSEEIMTLALIAFATPLGLNTIVFPAAYGGETETGASMVMISHILSVITIPLMYLLFIVLL